MTRGRLSRKGGKKSHLGWYFLCSGGYKGFTKVGSGTLNYEK